MTLRAHHLLASLLVGAIVLGSLAVLTVSPNVAQAACPTGSGVAIVSVAGSGGTTVNSTLAGVVTVKAQSTPTTATGLSFMLISPVQQAIGEDTLSGNIWST